MGDFNFNLNDSSYNVKGFIKIMDLMNLKDSLPATEATTD